MKRKEVALLLCFAMLVMLTVPGTLATSNDTDSIDSEFQINLDTEETSADTEPSTESETTLEPDVPADTDFTIDTELDESTESDMTQVTNYESMLVDELQNTLILMSDQEAYSIYEKLSLEKQLELNDYITENKLNPICTCGEEEHIEDCLKYVPVIEDDPSDEDNGSILDTPINECICGTTDGIHNENCPLYEAPDTSEITGEPTYIETCEDGCTGEGCECECHAMNLYDRLMACISLEEIDAVLNEAFDDELLALNEEELMEIEKHIKALEPEPSPAVVISGESAPPVQSEIVYPTVSYTNVAPLCDPVIGGAN